MEDEINLKVINCDDSYHKPVVKQWFSNVNLLMSLYSLNSETIVN